MIMIKYLDKISNINEDNIPNLDLVVMSALELFSVNKDFSLWEFWFNKPVIIWSGNAKNTSKIIYENTNAVFADENNYKESININWVDWVVIFSASWGKHAPIIAKYAISKNLKVKLITCNKENETNSIIWKENVIVTPKNMEPYTYNTSTYMWWIFAKTNENPVEIIEFIENKLDKILPNNFYTYNWFLFVIPNKFAWIAPLIDVKFIELFGRNVSRDIKTFEELKHAVTVVPNKKELCIKFGSEEIYYNGEVLNISLPENIWLAWFMAIWYYIVWKIQWQFPPYFKDNIKSYISYLNKSAFGKNMKVIV